MEALRAGPKSVSELAHPHDLPLPSFMQHLGLREEAGLVRRSCGQGDRRMRAETIDPQLDLVLERTVPAPPRAVWDA
jgi:DNA-binding transcriptional ArsR family regulator